MSTLTLKTIRDAMALLPIAPPVLRIDLYAHDLADRDRMYTIDRSKCADLYIGQDTSRQMLIVPRIRLDAIYHELRTAGIDVRLEPR